MVIIELLPVLSRNADVNENENLQRLLRDLGQAVFEAMSDSDDVSDTVNKFRAEGYSLTMQLNCKKDPERVAAGESVRTRADREPSFRIDGQDLSFLQSIGIDPTRRRPRRR